MSDIQQKAIALLNEVRAERGYDNVPISINRQTYMGEALCRAIEQHETTKQEYSDFQQLVSDAVVAYRLPQTRARGFATLKSFIIPAAKPDPLVEALMETELEFGPDWGWEKQAKVLRAALESHSLKIVELKNDD